MRLQLIDPVSVFIGTLSGIHVAALNQGEGDVDIKHSLSSHKITCCGVALSPREDFVTSGDFEGTVHVWPVGGSTSVATASIGSSVRCIVWPRDDAILIGGLSGELFLWDLKSIPRIIYKRDHALMSIKTSPLSLSGAVVLAIGTGVSELASYCFLVCSSALASSLVW